MPHWLIKSAIHRALWCLPRSHWWSQVFQTYVTRSLELDPRRFELRLEYCKEHLEHFLSLQTQAPERLAVLDLGTGWFPIVPVGLYLCGASEVWSFDIAPLLKRSRVARMLDLFCQYERQGSLKQYLPRMVPERMTGVRQALVRSQADAPENVLEGLNIHCLVKDAQETGLPPGAVDLFVSTSVLEYVPTGVLQSMLTEFARLASPRAVMSHFINLLDEYCHFDGSITPFNFLKYSSRSWNYLSSPLIWKNRLRISDYRTLFAAAGWRISREMNTSGSADELKRVQLAREFRHYATADLLVLRSWLVAQRALAGQAGSER